MMKKALFLMVWILSLPTFGRVSKVNEQDTLVQLMKESMYETFNQASSSSLYFIAMHVLDTKQLTMTYREGKFVEKEEDDRGLTTQVRVGDMHLDNFGNKIKVKHNFMGKLPKRFMYAPFTRLPTNCSSTSEVKNLMLKDLTDTYNESLSDYSNIQHADPLPFESFSKTPVSIYYEEPLCVLSSDKTKESLRAYVKEIGNLIDQQEELSNSKVTLTLTLRRNIVMNTEGTLTAQNATIYRLAISTSTQTEDKKEESLTSYFYAYRLKELPSIAELSGRIADQSARTQAKAQAPAGEEYDGPLLFSAQASGVLMHTLVGFYLQAETWKVYLNPIQKRVGERILPQEISICYAPSQKYRKGEPLMGYYRYDDEGTAAQSVTCIKDGIFCQPLMGRAPVDAFAGSNGHARAGLGADPSPRQSNMFVTSSKKYTEAELRDLFIQELRRTGREYGYYVRLMDNDHHCSYRIGSAYPPVRELYKVYVDGRPDTPVRGLTLMEDHWEMIRNIVAIGGKQEVTNGRCIYDNEELLTSVVAPMLYVKRAHLTTW